ncbi:MAG TPA: DUF459 domain-containing protein [Pseudolabrys sp.]|jgi:hypothetical protein
MIGMNLVRQLGKHFGRRWLLGAVVLAIAECATFAAVNVALIEPAQAQFFGEDRVRQRPQRSGGFFDSLFGGPSQRRDTFEEPERRPSYQGGSSGGGDSSRAPAARKVEKGEVPPTTSIVVMGDGMADWLAYGLEEAFGDAPEIGIIRKNRQRSGLIRYDVKGDLDWWHVARDLLVPEKPSYVVMMIGVGDRDNINLRDLAREAAKKEAEKKEAEKKEAEKKNAAQTPAATAPSDKPAAEKPATDKPVTDKPAADKLDEADKTAQATKDAEADKDPEEADQPAIIAPERGKRVSGVIEFRTEQWAQVYSRRIDDTLAALKSKGVPVFWVGLPSIKGTRSTADAVYLNDLYRARAEKAGAVYIDVWDGFVDESGKFTTNGPDYEGQVRRLRSADGVYFTKYGARKLAHYAEREIRRYMNNRSLVSLPSGPTGPVPADGQSAVRPLAGPVVPLTLVPGASEELLGGGSPVARGDAIATQVLVKGEPVAAPSGRADDFAWRQSGDAVAPPVAPAAARTGAMSAVTPASAPAASAYTEPEVVQKKPGPKAAPPVKTAEKKKPAPRQAQVAPRPPQPVQQRPSDPFGGLFR